MFGIGETEFAIILLFGFLLFGPDKLPGMGRTIGRALRQFREAQEDLNKVVQTEIVEPMEDVTKSIKFDDGAPESDSDRVSSSVSSEVKKESFAEKKARLQKEAAQDKQKAADEMGQDQEDGHAAQTKQGMDADLKNKAKDEKAEPEPAAPSAFDLYGLNDDDSHRGKEA